MKPDEDLVCEYCREREGSIWTGWEWLCSWCAWSEDMGGDCPWQSA